MTQEQLISIAAAVLSLLMAYVPGLADWYNAKTPQQKAGIMAILLILATVGVFALSCGGFVKLGVTCDQSGAVGLVQLLILALIANQGTFALLVRPYQK